MNTVCCPEVLPQERAGQRFHRPVVWLFGQEEALSCSAAGVVKPFSQVCCSKYLQAPNNGRSYCLVFVNQRFSEVCSQTHSLSTIWFSGPAHFGIRNQRPQADLSMYCSHLRAFLETANLGIGRPRVGPENSLFSQVSGGFWCWSRDHTLTTIGVTFDCE